MKKAVVYTRVSTNKEEQQKSLEIQEMQYTDYAEEKGFKLVKIYSDIGSGTNVRNRPSFIQMLHDAGLDYVRNIGQHDTFIKSKRKPKFNYIIVKDQSRLSRNMQQGIQIAQLLRDLKVYILFENSGVSTEEDDWKMRTSLLFMIAEEEARALGRRISNSKRYQMKQGVYSPAIVPIGYKRNDKKEIVVDEKYREMIQLIFELYKKQGTRSIARVLNKKGYKTNKGNKFSGDAVSDIIKNKVYCGSPHVGKYERVNVTDTSHQPTKKEDWIELTNAVDPIISEEEWNEAQKIRKQRAEENKSGETRGRKIPVNDDYFRKLECEKCGSHFVRHNGKNSDGSRKIFYMCYSRRKREGCDVRGISVNYLDTYLNGTNLNQHIDVISIYTQRSSLLEAIDKKLNSIEQEKQKIKSEILSLEKENKVIGENIVQGLLSSSEATVQLLSKQVEDNQTTIDNLKQRLNSLSDGSLLKLEEMVFKKDKIIQEFLEGKKLSFEEKLKHLKKFVVGDYKVVGYFSVMSYAEEMKQYNNLFPDDQLEIDDADFYNSRMWKRPHKAAREYWAKVSEEEENIYTMRQQKKDNK